MKYYQEITLIDCDKSPYQVWSELYNKLHIALADVKNKHGIQNIGVSFPNYKYEVSSDGKEFATLGNKLRLFAENADDLHTLDIAQWLRLLTGYVDIKKIAEVGDKAKNYVSVQRYRFKSFELQAKSLAKKLGIRYDEAMTSVAKRKPEMKLPFIIMRSQTNQKDYHLKILQHPIGGDEQSDNKLFNVYGMTGMNQKIAVPNW